MVCEALLRFAQPFRSTEVEVQVKLSLLNLPEYASPLTANFYVVRFV
jgi:hypothetical protein